MLSEFNKRELKGIYYQIEIRSEKDYGFFALNFRRTHPLIFLMSSSFSPFIINSRFYATCDISVKQI